jgi:hypothetical protein
MSATPLLERELKTKEAKYIGRQFQSLSIGFVSAA